MKSQNIYIIILVTAILFLLLDFVLSTIHLNLETFANSPGPSPIEDNTENPIEIEDDLFDKLNNKDLTIKDFYPRIKKDLPINTLKEMVFKHKLFHQILPNFTEGYLGIVWHEPKMYGIYSSNSLKSDSWTLIENSIPKNMLRPIFITFDKDRKLMAIFEEKDSYNVNKYHLYKKEEVDLNSPFKFIQKSPIVSCIFDNTDTLIGLDSKGNWYKKIGKDLESDWQKIKLGFTNIPMRKLLFDYRTKHMLGIGKDFRIYKKRGLDWLNQEWDTVNGPSKKTLGGTVKDLWLDYDGILMGISRVGLVKQKTGYYLSDFSPYETEIEKREISIYKVLYVSTGVETFGNESLNNNSNNVYVDGKKISEYKFRDPRLNKYLKHRVDMKKKCRRLKAMKIKQDEENKEVDDDIRNDRFMRILNEQKDTIDNLMDSITDLRNRNN